MKAPFHCCLVFGPVESLFRPAGQCLVHPLLVATRGRGHGFLRISVERPPDDDGSEFVTVRVCSEVANFYPMLEGTGWYRRIGRVIYRATQLRIHIIVTNAFLRSLARLDLEPSVVGSLREPADPVTSD